MMIGVVVLTFHSADVIEACLTSLVSADYSDLRIVVCDNNSQDNTLDVVRSWAQARDLDLAELDADAGPTAGEPSRVTLLHTGANLGFAGGVNKGLAHLMADPEIDLFWVLNPDSETAPETPAAYAKCAQEAKEFGIMGGRILYHDAPRLIQSDGGQIRAWSGICHNVNSGEEPDQAIRPAPENLDFISGANMVASRKFIERVGLMVEDYFLYYEEVDWAARRGDLPLLLCPDAKVIHHGGTVIGTGSVTRAASPFANFFNYRNRMRFMRRFQPWRLPVSWGLSMLRVVKMCLKGDTKGAWGAFTGLNGLPPPAAVRNRIAVQDRDMAFKMVDRTR